jgi:membrane-anchored mycosin MYCP
MGVPVQRELTPALDRLPGPPIPDLYPDSEDPLPTRRDRRTGPYVLLGMLCAVVGLVATMPARSAAARSASPDETVKYYVVESAFAGKPENLAEIAQRFLGSSARATEIFDLNVGRTQPDGEKLTDSTSLNPGWLLVLPWDAVGNGVKRGVLPTTQPQPYATPEPSGPTTPAPTAGCAGTKKQSTGTNGQWGWLRLAPEQAWPRTRGDGVLVALVDSGVDGALPQLAGRVTSGADVVSGSGRGNTDCLGTGTAMAGLIGAQSTQGGGPGGMAPGAVIVPIRVATTSPTARPADQASGIEIAISTGATVLAVGSYVDIRESVVARAIAKAADHNMVVVMEAPTNDAASTVGRTLVDESPGAPILRVGGIGIDGGLADKYVSNSIDVVAPGVGVTSLGINGTGYFEGTGTRYAVAYVAGHAALVRATQPNATAAEVVRRIKETASRMGGSPAPDPTYGWGLIDPEKATEPLPTAPSAASAPPAKEADIPIGALVVTVIVAVVVLLLLVMRVRWAVRKGSRQDESETTPMGPDHPPPSQPPGGDVRHVPPRESAPRGAALAIGAGASGRGGGSADAGGGFVRASAARRPEARLRQGQREEDVDVEHRSSYGSMAPAGPPQSPGTTALEVRGDRH